LQEQSTTPPTRLDAHRIRFHQYQPNAAILRAGTHLAAMADHRSTAPLSDHVSTPIQAQPLLVTLQSTERLLLSSLNSKKQNFHSMQQLNLVPHDQPSTTPRNPR